MGERPGVAIIGAGFSGVGMAIRLKQAGYKNVTVFDKAPKVGGAWYWNTYPGCACDVPAHLYSYSFAPWGEWSHVYPGAAEIQAYIERVVDAFGVRPWLRLGVEVHAARWDEAARLWRLVLADGSIHEAQILIAGLGQLDIPKYPDIEGRETFSGAAFHSARWDWTVPLEGKRVAVIGAAASAVQLIPEIAPKVAHLDVYQRTPNYIVPRNDRAFAAWEKRYYASNVWALQMSRQAIYWRSDTLFWGVFKGSGWRVRLFEDAARKHLEDQVKDPVLREKLTPSYAIGCKRVLITDAYYPALQRDNVALVADPIARIDPDGVRTTDQRLRPADVIVYATGFDASRFHWRVEIEGSAGRLNDVWRGGAEAYLGLATKGFPNFFMLYGPNTNLGHTSILVMVEEQISYILRLLAMMDARGASVAEVSPNAQARYNAVLQADLKASPWASDCGSWYKTEEGKIANNWPHSTQDYARVMRRIEPASWALQ
jgi:cation diffusion facilitator CzcD-associated flavoprotein CzcO